MIFDKAGNLYGTTYIGGTGTGTACDSKGCGTVFELSPRADGTWNESILHSFSENGTDGYLTCASVILGSGGVLYGTAPFGGNQTNCYGGACGIAFALVPKSGGGWTEKILYNFSGDSGGGTEPDVALTFGPNGSLLGTTCFGGTDNSGTLFALLP